MSIQYPNLRQQQNEETKRAEWVYGRDATRLYPGKICNNVTQAVARIVMTDGMLRAGRKDHIVMTVHDEFAIIVPDAFVEAAAEGVRCQMCVPPVWAAGLPLDSEVGYARRYGLAK
jgi:dihydroorotase